MSAYVGRSKNLKDLTVGRVASAREARWHADAGGARGPGILWVQGLLVNKDTHRP